MVGLRPQTRAEFICPEWFERELILRVQSECQVGCVSLALFIWKWRSYCKRMKWWVHPSSCLLTIDSFCWSFIREPWTFAKNNKLLLIYDIFMWKYLCSFCQRMALSRLQVILKLGSLPEFFILLFVGGVKKDVLLGIKSCSGLCEHQSFFLLRSGKQVTVN